MGSPAMADENRTLIASQILKTIDALHDRIYARFGERGLTKTCRDLQQIARRNAETAAKIGHPYIALRLLVYSIVAFGLYGIYSLYQYYAPDAQSEVGFGALFFAQGLESLVNLAILCAGALFFVINFESRLKRRLALRGLHELRSLAHVIDMHQLTKDPQSMLVAQPTRASPKRDLSPPQLMRYLDYCTEMLSLIAKVAALYGENFPNTAVMAAVNDVESLASSLSAKIFQKIHMIQTEMMDKPPAQSGYAAAMNK
jgi:hypothetical protein